MKKKLLLLAGALVMLGVLVLVVAFSAGLGFGRFMRRATGTDRSGHGDSSHDGPSYFDDARPLGEGFGPALGSKPELCSLIIREHEAALTMRTGPEETQEQLLRQADGHVSTNGHGFCTADSVRSLNDAVFPWSDVDLGVVAAMATEAQGKLGLDSSTRLSHLLLERDLLPPVGPPPADGGPVLRSAPPRWKAIFSSSAAYAEFDLAGRFVGGMQAGGAPVGPGGAVTYLDDATAVAKVIAETLGQDVKLAELEIFPSSFIFEGRRATVTTGVGRYTYRMSALSGPDKATAELYPNVEERLFPLSDLDFSLVPRIVRDARAELGMPDAAASEIKAEKTLLQPELRWTVHLVGAESRPLAFDMKGKRVGNGAPAAADSDAIQAADLEHVDLLDLLPQATTVARRLEPRAVLVHITGLVPFAGGTVDLRGKAGAHYDYEYSYLDRTKPPGQDKIEGNIWVMAENGRLRTNQGSVAFILGSSRYASAAPAPEPRCPVQKAWRIVVQSGVPANALANVSLEIYQFGRSLPHWWFMVDGHPDYERKVDAVTCSIMGRVKPPGAEKRP